MCVCVRERGGLERMGERGREMREGGRHKDCV